MHCIKKRDAQPNRHCYANDMGKNELEEDVRKLSEAMDQIAKLVIATGVVKKPQDGSQEPQGPQVQQQMQTPKKKKKKKNKIHCSYCNEVGHTRARCPKKLGLIDI
ncbi:uncharacterized protein CGFF_04947 [Nakaseomyces glabratus]|nr:C2H2 zinc-finger [Nakaseomyces glabratus]QNG15475.1 uncharacterized protein GWK60_K01793 [Nakaseomyces glabratus]SCV17385.1 uncharacterized protein CGFF_04947 [Nakaseomyces glabratus]SLM17177.1 uncharacterized protein CGFF_04947 [Nakaseomyces glabratus]